MPFTADELEEIRKADAEIDKEMALSPEEERKLKNADRYHSWYIRHKSEKSAYNKKYYAENTEHCKERSRKYRERKKSIRHTYGGIA